MNNLAKVEHLLEELVKEKQKANKLKEVELEIIVFEKLDEDQIDRFINDIKKLK